MAAVTQTEADLRAAARMANPAAQPLHTDSQAVVPYGGMVLFDGAARRITVTC